METFYLGTHHPSWLQQTSVPLFVSRRALVMRGDRQRRALPRARGPWALDSAGFTELNLHGHHHVSARQYAAEVCRYSEEIGKLQWASIQDWMVEPSVRDITKRTVREHQLLTVESFMELRTIAPSLPWAPVLQGWFEGDHEEHLALYHRNGIDLRCEKIVGVGSVCRRQGTVAADRIVKRLSQFDLRLHLFGYKATGLPATFNYITSADSMAWSMVARKQNIHLAGCEHIYATGKKLKGGRWHHRAGDPSPCGNCLRFALRWRRQLLDAVSRSADPDWVERHWGHRDPTDVEVEKYLAIDPAEGVSLSDFLEGDYHLTAARLERISGRKVSTVPDCHFTGSAGSPCVSARYRSPGEASPSTTSLRREHVDDLPSAGGEPSAFVPWRPRRPTGARRRAVGAQPELMLRREARAHRLGDARIDPFREQRTSLRRAGVTVGRARIERVKAMPLALLQRARMADRSALPRLPDRVWEGLDRAAIVDLVEHQLGDVRLAARIDGWLRFGPPAPVIVQTSRGATIETGATQVDVMRLLGREAMPVIHVSYPANRRAHRDRPTENRGLR